MATYKRLMTFVDLYNRANHNHNQDPHMPHKSLKQNGFSAVEGLLSIIAVAIVIFVGFYVYYAQKNTNSTLNSASKVASQPAPTVTKKAATPNTTASANPDTLDIKEWSVTFKLTDPTITDPVYDTPVVDPATGLSKVVLGSSNLTSVSTCADGTKIVQNRTDNLYRSTDASKVVLADSSPAKKIGDYYYSIERVDQGVCKPDANAVPSFSSIVSAYISNWNANNLIVNN